MYNYVLNCLHNFIIIIYMDPVHVLMCVLSSIIVSGMYMYISITIGYFDQLLLQSTHNLLTLPFDLVLFTK